MFIISAIIDFETEKERDEVVKISIPIQKATREQELGCISYCFAADPVVANRTIEKCSRCSWKVISSLVKIRFIE